MEDHTVYDLGEVNEVARNERVPPLPRPPLKPGVRPASARRVEDAPRPARAPRQGGVSLALFLPGAAQLARGEIASGLFLLSHCGLAVAVGWAILRTLTPLTSSFETLGLSGAWPVWILMATYVVLAALHLASVATTSRDRDRRPHPVTAGVASALLPGWGQLLNGSRARAVLFLAGLWLAGAARLLSSSWAGDLLESHGLFLPPEARAFTSSFMRSTLPGVVWALATYDAVATAAHNRRSART